MLGKLLIAALCVVWMWIFCICAWFIGWLPALAVAAAAVPVTLLAEHDPDRWGWLIGRKPPSNPDA